MAVAAPPWLIQQLFDNNGLLNADGTLEFYVAGQMTPQAVFLDGNGITGVNSITLDSSGRCSFWMTEGASYKVIQKDANGVTLTTTDDIDIPAAPVLAATPEIAAFEVLDARAPLTDELLGIYVFTDDVLFPVNFAGAQGQVIVANPTASFVAKIKRGATQVGTMTISTAGAFTFATTGGATITYTAGQAMTVYAPTVVDATLEGFAWTIPGSVI